MICYRYPYSFGNISAQQPVYFKKRTIMKTKLPLLLVLCALALSSCDLRTGKASGRDLSVRDSVLVDYMSYAAQFSDCSFVDWDTLAVMRIMQDMGDWDASIDEKIHPGWRVDNMVTGCWVILQNAKAMVHFKSIPLRAVSSRRFCRRLDALERSFEEAFEQMVTQEYYLRCFEDVFDEVVAPKVEDIWRYRMIPGSAELIFL